MKRKISKNTLTALLKFGSVTDNLQIYAGYPSSTPYPTLLRTRGAEVGVGCGVRGQARRGNKARPRLLVGCKCLLVLVHLPVKNRGSDSHIVRRLHTQTSKTGILWLVNNYNKYIASSNYRSSIITSTLIGYKGCSRCIWCNYYPSHESAFCGRLKGVCTRPFTGLNTAETSSSSVFTTSNDT